MEKEVRDEGGLEGVVVVGWESGIGGGDFSGDGEGVGDGDVDMPGEWVGNAMVVGELGEGISA